VRFEIDRAVFEKRPDFVVGIVAARGIDNARASAAILERLRTAVREAVPGLAGRVKEDPRLLPYREAFLAFGINPNKYMPSIEALMTRIQKTGALSPINPVVDLGNAVSVAGFLPVGAHDLGMSDRLELRPAKAGDYFIPFGAAEREAVEAGELVYASGASVRTRRWMWRQSEEGKIGPATSSVFFPIDGFRGFNEAAVLAARDELARLLVAELGGQVIVGLALREDPIFEA
jgi:DNA/RNA-binding domain of Phe-tRNA-synthetase-like protein